MSIDIADANSVQCMVADEPQHLVVGCIAGLGQVLEGTQNHIALLQTAQCEFP